MTYISRMVYRSVFKVAEILPLFS